MKLLSLSLILVLTSCANERIKSTCNSESIKKVTCKCKYGYKIIDRRISGWSDNDSIEAKDLDTALSSCKELGKIQNEQISYNHQIFDCK